MEGWTERIVSVLDRTPTRAMSLSRLMGALEEEGVTVAGLESWILQRVGEQPETFRVIPDRLGPWISWPWEEPTACGLPSSKSGCDPWILACSPAPPLSMDSDRMVLGRIQESLQAWGRDVDDGSHVAVARWGGANREAQKAFGNHLRLETDRTQKPPSTNRPLRRIRRR